jgi:hypothetical protein
MSESLAATTSLYWTNPAAEEEQPTLVRLTPTALTLAVVPAADLDNVVAALQGGEEELAGQVIPLSSVAGAEGADEEAELTVSYRTGPSKTESATIPFADAAKREEFLVALLGGLGPAWQRRQKPVSRWKAGFWVLLPTVVLALVTWGLHVEAARIAEGKQPANWGRQRKLKFLAEIAHWVERQIGPTGVLIAGATLVGLGILIFLWVMASPPLRVVVEPARELSEPSGSRSVG